MEYVTDQFGLGGLIVMPTGSGKSLVMAALVKHLFTRGYMKILVIAHKRELVQQNHDEAREHFLDMSLRPTTGICCASLKRKETGPNIIFATIQSIFRKPQDFVPVDLVLIDEAHMCSRQNTTMYRKFIDGLSVYFKVPVLGLTATPYRLEGSKTNMLIGGKTALFDTIVHDTPADDLVQQGYLTPIVSHDVLAHDVTGVGVARGDFVRSELEERVVIPDVVRSNVEETLSHGQTRKCWLIFCCGVKHAHVVRDAFLERGYDIPVVVAETPEDKRDKILNALKQGTLQGAINVEVATTGFDAKHIDMIAMMRPTKSKALFTQVIGRGMRLANGKENCLLLDFGGNVERLGTSYGLPFEIGTDIKSDEWECQGIEVNGLEVHAGCGHVNPAHKRKCGSCGAVRPAGYGPTKECGECGAIVSVAARHCPECEGLFLKLDDKPSNIVWREEYDKGPWGGKWLPVRKFALHARESSAGRDMLTVQVTYEGGATEFYPYFPTVRSGAIHKKFRTLHKILAVDPTVDVPSMAMDCKYLLMEKMWRVPTGLVPAKDADDFLYLEDARFDVYKKQ